MGKNFNHQHALDLVKICNQYKIKTQACFLIGHPLEREEDFLLTCKYLKKLVQQGLSEAAFFIVSPFAGSELYKKNSIPMKEEDISIVTFSPSSRKDWDVVKKRRKKLLAIFFIEKLKRPFDFFKHIANSLTLRPKNKMENLVGRYLFLNIFLKSKHKIKYFCKSRSNLNDL